MLCFLPFIGILRFISSFVFYILAQENWGVLSEALKSLNAITNYLLWRASIIGVIGLIVWIILLATSKTSLDQKIIRKEALSVGRQKAKMYIRKSVLIIFLAIVLNFVAQIFVWITTTFVSAVIESETATWIISVILSIVIEWVWIYLLVWLYKLLLNAVQEKETWLNLFFKTSFVTYRRFLIAYILYSIICIIGTLLLIVPWVILGIKLKFFPYLIIEKNMGIRESLKTSWYMTDNQLWELLVYYILGWLMTWLGTVLTFGIFGLWLFPMFFLWDAFIYEKLKK